MFSKLLELTGLALVALACALLLGAAAGLLTGGLALLLIGGTTDDAAVGRTLRQGWGWVRYRWYRRIYAEELSTNARSPQPPIKIDPEAQHLADRLAKARVERAKAAHDRSPALRRYEPEKESEEDVLERLA